MSNRLISKAGVLGLALCFCLSTMVWFDAFAGPAVPPVGTQVAVQETALASADGDGSAGHDEGLGITHRMMILVLQLAVIIIVARVGGEVFERFLKQPAVLGELAAGMIIGPYALGPYIGIFDIGPLFPLLEGAFPVTVELYGIATVASVILLFMVGLETDFYKFMRYAWPGFAVGVGGVLGSFITGDLIYVWYSGESFMSPSALFMGTVSTATSVGITARVLSEKKKMDSAEGTTILAGAVIDDVLGIMTLAVVGGVAAVSAAGGGVNWGHIGLITIKAFGFWLVATVLGILVSGKMASFMLWFKTAGAPVALGLGFALLMAGIAESFGLAMIIGAYIMGLSLSKEEISHLLESKLRPLYACLVPVFFAVMGMLVNFEAMLQAVWFGLLYSIIAVFAKVLCSGIPCFFVGFNLLGATRVGIGMLPRGEVALIVAGVGISQGFIGQDMFGVVIMMTLITTVIAPPVLVGLFGIQKSGVKGEIESLKKEPEKLFFFDSLTWTNHDLLISCIQKGFCDRGFVFNIVNMEDGIFQFTGEIEGERTHISMEDYQDKIRIRANPKYNQFVKEVLEISKEDAVTRIGALQVKEEPAD